MKPYLPVLSTRYSSTTSSTYPTQTHTVQLTTVVQLSVQLDYHSNWWRNHIPAVNWNTGGSGIDFQSSTTVDVANTTFSIFSEFQTQKLGWCTYNLEMPQHVPRLNFKYQRVGYIMAGGLVVLAFVLRVTILTVRCRWLEPLLHPGRAYKMLSYRAIWTDPKCTAWRPVQ